MAFTNQLDQTRKDLEKAISDPTPLYAVVGAGDLAIGKLRGAREELSAMATKGPRALRDQAQAVLEEASARADAVQADVKAAPDEMLALPVKAQNLLGEMLTTAVSMYGELAGRGKSLVTRVRKQQATVDLTHQAKSTVSKVKAASTTAERSAAATRTSVKATTTRAKRAAAATRPSAKATGTTAKKSTAKTATSVKAATTSARKTASAAKKAASSAAAKTGK
ncbi:MAG: hypothetical protein ACR2KG_01325 [Nocardioidaceae bacterium]